MSDTARLTSKAEAFMTLVLAHVEHGDADHRNWLKTELEKLTPTLKILFKESVTDGVVL